MRHFSRLIAQGKLGLLLGFVASLLALSVLVTSAFAASTGRNSQSSQKTWKVVSSPSEGVLQGVAAISANDVWSVGNLDFVTVTEHWNGTAWSIVASPNPAPENNLMSVAAVSTRNVWTVGWQFFPSAADHTAPLIEHWNGTAWSIVASPNPNSNSYLNSVTVVSASDIWAVGYTITQQGNQPLIEQWNGTSWNVISSPSAGQLNGVAAVSANDVWAVGMIKGQTLILHWNGKSWTVVSSPSTFYSVLNGVSVVSASDIWAVGSRPGKTKTATLTEHWNGTNWKIVASPNVRGGPEGDELNAVSVVSTNNVWAVGMYSTGVYSNNPLFEHWNGSAWKAVINPSPGLYNTLYGVASVPGSKHLWAAGYFAPSGGEPDNTLTEYYG